MTLKQITAKVAEVRKALVAAAAVATTIAATAGVPANVKVGAADVVAVLAAFGIAWRVPNKPQA